jgi:diaminopimelate epimerase
MHGAGNDFVVLDATCDRIELSAAQVRAIADRHRGIGADQILIVGAAADVPAGLTDIDFSYRIFNADGGEVEQCGNGARAFVRFVHDKGLSSKNPIRVATLGGVITPFLELDGSVTVDMGAPATDPADVPFDTEGLRARKEAQLDFWPLELAGGCVEVAVVSMGNPHAVQVVEQAANALVALQGPLIESHFRFPQRTNAGFLQIDGPQEIHLRVWERGTGETLACGTGACAAVVSGILANRLLSPVLVHTHGGDLRISWTGPGHSVLLNGPAVAVFDGELDLAALEL